MCRAILYMIFEPTFSFSFLCVEFSYHCLSCSVHCSPCCLFFCPYTMFYGYVYLFCWFKKILYLLLPHHSFFSSTTFPASSVHYSWFLYIPASPGLFWHTLLLLLTQQMYCISSVPRSSGDPSVSCSESLYFILTLSSSFIPCVHFRHFNVFRRNIY